MALNLATDIVGLLQQIVDIGSVSGQEDALATQVVDTLSACPHLRVARYGNAVVARTELGRPTRVTIAGHIDTVPVAGNLPSWRRTVDGQDRVYGRGTCDQLGGIATQIAVAVAVTEPVNDVTWIFYDCEEIESARNGLGRLQREHPELFDSVFAVLTEPSGAIVEGGCQGTVRVRVCARGVSAHSARPWTGSNAIHALAGALNRLDAHEGRCPEVDGLTYRESLSAVRVGGGVAGNVIPAEAWLEVNYRYAPDRSSGEAEEFVRKFFDGYDIEVVDNAPGARPGLDQSVAAEFLQSVGGVARPKLGWTDVARFSALGIPAVNFGPGDPTKAHADDEYVPVSQLRACHDALARWLGRG